MRDSHRRLARPHVEEHRLGRCAGIIEDFDLGSTGQAKHVAGVVGLGGIEQNLAEAKAWDVNSSGHAGDYQPPVMGWQQFAEMTQAEVHRGRQASDKARGISVE